MKRLSRVLLAVGISLLVVTALWGQGYRDTITATDGPNSQVLIIGADPTAHFGIDAGLGEVEEPMPAITGAFDARLASPGSRPDMIGAGSWVDIRPFSSNFQTDSFHVFVQPSSEATPALTVSLNWDQAKVPAGIWHLVSVPAGVDVDMKKVSTYAIDVTLDGYSATKADLYIIHTDTIGFTTVTYDRFYSDVDLAAKHGKGVKRSVKAASMGLPNVHNIGEELNLVSDIKTNGLMWLGTDHVVKGVFLKKYGDLLKSAYSKDNSQHSIDSAFCISYPHVAKAKFYKKFLKVMDPTLTPKYKGQQNGFFAQLMTLKFNILASQYGKTPPTTHFANEGYTFGGLFINDGASVVPPATTVSAFATLCDANLSCVGDTSLATLKELAVELQKINGYFDRTAFFHKVTPAAFDTCSEVGAEWNVDYAKLHPATGKAKVAAAKAGNLELAPWIYLGFQGKLGLVDVGSGAPINTHQVVGAQPEQYRLNQNYPNPFNPTTSIRVDLANSGLVTVKVFNMLGQEVGTLVDREEMNAGQQVIEFNASNLASGVYFYRVSVNDAQSGKLLFQDMKKMTLVK